MRNSKLTNTLIVVPSLALAVAVVLFVGYAIGRYDYWPGNLLLAVENRLLPFTLRGPAGESSADRKTVTSIFLRLDATTIPVPVEREGNGGGLTSFGDEVLLVTHEGGMFSAKGADSLVRLPIEAPDNGLAAYMRAAATDRFSDMTHRFAYMRYNDIMYYGTRTGHGLAISYTEFVEGKQCYVNAIALLRLDRSVQSLEEVSAAPNDWDLLYRSKPCLPLKAEWRAIEGHMAGGRMAFSAPRTIYIGNGDYHWDGIYAPKALSQDQQADYGKVISIDIETGESKVVSIGSRNIQGIVLDDKDQLWIAEHGMRGGDELNRIVTGGNYGWPAESLGTAYSSLPIAGTVSYGRHDRYIAPTFSWLPSVAVSSLAQIKGFHDSWDGDLLMASLRDQSLFRIRIRDDRVLFAEKITVGKRIRYAHQHSDGRLVLWTDDKKLMFLTPSERTFAREFVDNYIAQLDLSSSRKARLQTALGSCLECHSLEPGENEGAPSLGLVYGSATGSTSFSGYSEAFRAHHGYWTMDALIAFIQNPSETIPGTIMPDTGIDDPVTATEIARLLEAMQNIPE